MAKVISYVKEPISIVAPDGSWANWAINTSYDNAEFDLATGQTDYDVSAGQANAFNNIEIARYICIRTNETITLKCNAITNNSITITSSDSPFVINTLEVTNLFITNASGSTASIKTYLV